MRVPLYKEIINYVCMTPFSVAVILLLLLLLHDAVKRVYKIWIQYARKWSVNASLLHCSGNMKFFICSGMNLN